MTHPYEYMLAAAFLTIALLPIRSYDLVQDKAMHLGVVVALALNLYFYLQLDSQEGMRRFREWHLPIAFYFPVLAVCPLLVMVVVSKGLLRGNTPLKQWGSTQAKRLLADEGSVIRRLLARTYLATDPPMMFFLGWGLGSSLFVRFVFHNH